VTADELLDHLAAHDVRLAADGDRLRYDGPSGAVTGTLVEDLRRSTDRFAAATIERRAADSVRLQEAAGRDPDRPLAELAPEAGGSHARDRT
jgi:TubC N-terminal docking domain